MPSSIIIPSRRLFLQHAAFAAAAFSARGLFAEQLTSTPAMTEGPFYPGHMPLDTDNDLLLINDSITPAVGEITHLTGRILTSSGRPIRNAFVEIWQVDHNGVYLNSGDTRIRDQRDTHFQGYGRFLTDSKGQYYFRTIKPVPYTGRTPHIHFGISRNGRRIFTTQLFVKGEPQNQRDGVFRGIGDPDQEKSVLVDFVPIRESRIGELAASFDIVIGRTFEDRDEAEGIKGGIAPAQRMRGGPGGPGRGRGGPGRGFGDLPEIPSPRS